MAPGAAVVALFAALVVAMYVVLSALSLSGAQVADRDLGRYGASVGFGAVTAAPGDRRTASLLERSAVAGGARDPLVALVASDVQITRDPRTVWTLTEAAWVDRPFPRRYALRDGRWPVRPGEVVVADAPDDGVQIGSRLPVFGGAHHVEVVGHAADAFARTPSVLAGVGTWAQVPASVLDKHRIARASPVLYWAGNDPERVAQAFERTVAGLPDGQPEVVASTLRIRSQVEQYPELSWLQRSPAGYRIPSIVLPLLAVGVLYGSQSRRLGGSLAIMRELGVRRRDARTGAAVAVGSWALPASLGGSVAGLGLGLALRPLASALRERPAGPVPDLAPPIATGLGLTALAVIGGALLLRSPRPVFQAAQYRPATSGEGAQGVGTAARRALGVCLLVVTAAAVPATSSPARAALLSAALTVGVLLLLPEVVTVSLRWLPERGPRARLARRQMVRDRNAVTAAVGLSTFLLSTSLGYTVLFSSLVTSFNAANHPDVLSGQVLVQDRSSVAQPPSPAALAVVAASGVGATVPGTPLGYTVAVDASGNSTSVATVADAGTLIAVTDTAAVRGLLARALSRAQRRTLEGGGVLVWDVPVQDGRVGLTVTPTSPGPTRQVTADARAVDPPRAGWAAGSSGVVLTAAAERLGLPVTVGPVAYLGLQDGQVEAVRRSIADSGLDATTVLVPRDPPPVIPQAGFVVTVVGLAFMAVAGAVASTRAQVRTLRGYLAQLQSLGLSRRWTSAVLLRQVAYVAATSTVLALLIATPPLLAATANIRGLVLDIPYRDVLAFTTTVYAATCGAALLAARRISVRQHLQEV